MSATLSASLTSSFFSAAEVPRLLETADAPERPKMLEAVRAESLERFVDALGVVFRAVDWSSSPTVLEPQLKLIGWPCLDHLRVADVLAFAQQVDGPDGDFALDVVRAVELDDAAAAARVRERLGSKARPPAAFSLPADAVGGVRAAKLLRPLLAATDEALVREAVDAGVGCGNWGAHLVAAVAASRGLALPEEVAELQDHRRLVGRLLTWLAAQIDAELGEEILSAVVAKDYWDTGDLETYDLAWDRAVEKVSGGKLSVTRQLGSTVLKATAPFDAYAGPPPKKAVKWKLSAKRYGDAKKAAKELDKAAAAAGDAPACEQADLDARLFRQAGERERVRELLRRGASPNGGSDPDPYWRGYTTLHRATGSSDCSEIIGLLLGAGADPGATFQGKNAIDLLSGREAAASAAVDRLVAAGIRSSHPGNLLEAAERGHHRFVAALLRAGADGGPAREVAVKNRNARTAVALGHTM